MHVPLYVLPLYIFVPNSTPTIHAYINIFVCVSVYTCIRTHVYTHPSIYLLRLFILHMFMLLNLGLHPNAATFRCAAVPTIPFQTGNNSLLQVDPSPENQEKKTEGHMVASLEEALTSFVTSLYNNLSWKEPPEVIWSHTLPEEGPVLTPSPTSKSV